MKSLYFCGMPPKPLYNFNELKDFLDSKTEQYNRPEFIENDPVCIPHLFEKKQDMEIMGFFAAMLAWGQRKTIINKCRELIDRMGGTPFDFIMNHSEQDLASLAGFKHRTFNDTDLLYFVHFFREHYSEFSSLEDAFDPSVTGLKRMENYRDDFKDSSIAIAELKNSSSVCYQDELHQNNKSIETALNHFRAYFFSFPDFPRRTIKHISSPTQKSTCKRLNMFLRWMVRNDNKGVDFGIWDHLKPSELICPCDLHVDRVSRKLSLISRKQTDWQTAVELTSRLREFDPADPVKYDFALFGLGIEEKF
jgi:uncharacterized protein (TIGR02757 family)